MKNKYLIFAFLFLLTGCFISCSSDNDNIDDMVEAPKDYKLVSIMWKMDVESGDGLEIISQKIPTKIYSNNGNTEIPVEIKPLDEIEQTSYFGCENKDIDFLSKWREANNLQVSVPSEPSLLSDRYSYIVGGNETIIDFMKKSDVEKTTEITDATKLPPNTKMTYDATIYLKKITATYCMEFATEDNPYNSIKVVGKWTGTFFNNIESRTVYDYIK